MGEDERLLIGALMAAPEEATLKLAYADLLDETGRGARARFIRSHSAAPEADPGSEWHRVLEDHGEAVAFGHARFAWSELFGPSAVRDGFFSAVTAPDVFEYLEYAADLFTAQPCIRHVWHRCCPYPRGYTADSTKTFLFYAAPNRRLRTQDVIPDAVFPDAARFGEVISGGRAVMFQTPQAAVGALTLALVAYGRRAARAALGLPPEIEEPTG